MMRRLRFDKALPWTDQTLWEWFSGLNPRIWYFHVGDGNGLCSPCSPGSATLHIPLLARDRSTWPEIESLIGGLIHEARHIEVSSHMCGSRDYRVADLQAFGVHNLFFTWIAEHSDPTVIPVEYRAEAAAVACNQRNSAFCNDECIH